MSTDRDRKAEYYMIYGRSPADGGEGVFNADDEKQCGVRSNIDTVRDFVTLSAPRRCFGSPRRAKAMADFYGLDGPDCCEDAYFDWTRYTGLAKRN